jgi:hypothetical protein
LASAIGAVPSAARGQRHEDADEVRHLGRAAHDELLTGRVDHGGAGLHERRDESLLAEPPLDHHAVRVGAGGLDRRVHVAAEAARRRVEGSTRR